MRIFHIITRFIRGGADENTLISCNGQVLDGHDVYLIYGRENHPSILEKLHPSVKQICLPSIRRELSVPNDLQAINDIRRLCRQLKPDIVHTHTSKAGFVGRVGAWLGGCRTIIHGVHILPFLAMSGVSRAAFLAAERIAAPMTTAFIDVSEAMRSECLNAGLGTNDNHYFIPSGMDIDAFKTAQPIGSNEFGEFLPSDMKDWDEANVIVMAAAFEARKRQLQFIDVFKEISRRDPKAVLLLAGDGVQRGLIEQKINAAGLAERVKVLGFRTDLQRWLKLAKLCVLSSEREGLPRVIVQYAAAGKPIVSTFLPGIDIIIKQGRNGYIVDRPEDMVEPVLALLSDEQTHRSFSDHARNIDLRRWSGDYMVARIQEVYDRHAGGQYPPLGQQVTVS